MRPSRIALVLLAFAVPACERADTPPTDLPQFNFMNAPDELPNVLRSQFAYAVAVFDPAAGLRAIAGLPTVPASHISCQALGSQYTGTEDFQLHDEQLVGSEPPYVYLDNTADVNLHVYQASTFMGFCRSTVYAQGTGKLIATDNDFTGSGTRGNVWGFHMTGEVTIASTGEKAQLNAFARFQLGPDGAVQILTRQVQLN